MNLPFTAEQFLGVFERYNLAIWPMPIVAYALGLAALWLAVRPTPYTDRLITGILAFFWLWTGVLYHGVFFREINPIALGFGALFVIQAGLLVHAGLLRRELRFAASTTLPGLIGGLFLLYATLIYPIVGALLGHGYPRGPMFGLAPCPVAIFTMGLLLWTTARVPKTVLIIPVLWSLLGVSAALQLGIREDLGLLVAGVLGAALVLWRDRHGLATGLRQRMA